MTGVGRDDSWHGKSLEGHSHELRWDTSMSGITRNHNGSTGWARVIRSSGGDVPDGSCRRVHKCAHSPCEAQWKNSKSGLQGPPIHVQEVDAAAAIFGPAVPSSVPLRSGHIPSASAMSPARPQLRVGCPQLRRGCAAVAEESICAESGHKVFQTILELARRIRSERSYVGYSFFVLLAISKNANPSCGKVANE